MAKNEKGMRECGVCHKTGHNMRTCPVQKQRNAAKAGEEAASQILAAPRHVAVEAPSRGPSDSKLEPASFEEQRIQAHLHGQTIVASAREYANGSCTVSLRHLGVAIDTKEEMHLDLEGAAKLSQMLTVILQRQVAAQAVKHKSLARTNGLVQPAPAPHPQIEAHS